MKIIWAGSPGDIGGANTECWHTIKLLRSRGVEVSVLEVADVPPAWQKRLRAIGCDIIQMDAPIKNAVVVSMCNPVFLIYAPQFRDNGCRIVWVPCMTYPHPAEHSHYARYGKAFDAYVFQSAWQRKRLEGWLRDVAGYIPKQGHTIRGAFDPDEFPYSPRTRVAGKPFVVGRISRPALDKYHEKFWQHYRPISKPRRVRVMAWNKGIGRKCGPTPKWADTMPAGYEPAQVFLQQLHCMMQVNGGAQENWPRSGLEAMSTGVPVVAEDRWGWREMIVHGETGFLAENNYAECVNALAADEPLRLRIARQARDRLVDELANPDTIWGQWEHLLSEVA